MELQQSSSNIDKIRNEKNKLKEQLRKMKDAHSKKSHSLMDRIINKARGTDASGLNSFYLHERELEKFDFKRSNQKTKVSAEML